MEAFVKESLRSWGINFVERTCTKEYHIPELNITIPEGALVQIPGSSIMHEEVHFQVINLIIDPKQLLKHSLEMVIVEWTPQIGKLFTLN